MTKIGHLTLATICGQLVAYDSDKLTLKMDGDKPVIRDGKPVYLKPDGSEFVADVNQMFSTISRLTNEARTHREAKEAVEAKLAEFGDVDAKAAKEALAKIKDVDFSKLIGLDKVEELKAELKKQYDEQIANEKKNSESWQQKHNNLVRSNAFNRSKYIQDKIAAPLDMFENTFGNYFKVEDDGTIRAYENGQPIQSKTRIGEVATFDEALEILVDRYPHKDMILKGTGHSGGGSTGGTGGGNGAARYSRDDFEKLPPLKQAEIAKAAKEGKAQITD